MPTPILMYAVPVLIMFVSLPLILKKIPKNAFYGFRTKKTMSGTDEYWYRANRSAGFAMFLAGVVSFLASMVIPLFMSDEKRIVSIWSFVLIASVIVAFCFSMLKDTKSDQ